MPTRLVPTLGTRRALRLVERNYTVYRKHWLLFASGFFEPLFFLLSLGIGLNGLVGQLTLDGQHVSYAVFVAPGMLATTAMNGAMFDTVFNTFFKLRIAHQYDSVLTTPLSVGDVALGEIWWSLARAAIYGASFIACMAVLGDTTSWWVLACWPGMVLTSLCFNCLGLLACTYLRSWQDFDLVILVELPMFLFSATFFPLSLYPRWLGALVHVSPLYQATTLLRGFSVGALSWTMAWPVLYLAGISVVALAMASRRLSGILNP